MTRLLLTLAGWLALVLLFLGAARWIKARSRGRYAPEGAAPEGEPAGPPLAGTSEPLPAVLEPHRAELEPLLAPSVQLVPGGEPVARLGGEAHLPPEVEWPASPANPMSFVGELDLAALRRAAPEAAAALPDEGWLALFYDVEEMPWGYGPGHGAFFRVLHLTGERAKRSAPDGAAVFLERVLGGRQVRVLPAPDDLPEGLRLGDGAIEPYRALASKLVGDPDHRVGGHASWIQSDASWNRSDGRAEAAAGPAGGSGDSPTPATGTRAGMGRAAAKVWRLLWQIDTDAAAGFMWGAAGRLYLLARDEDLKARRFDRVWLVLQCY
jgi:hypothetical protein